jgi:hypothetical protein
VSDDFEKALGATRGRGNLPQDVDYSLEPKLRSMGALVWCPECLAQFGMMHYCPWCEVKLVEFSEVRERRLEREREDSTDV